MTIQENIMQHISLLESLVTSTRSMIKAAKDEKFQLVEEISINRERLINVIKHVQDSIEARLEGAKMDENEIGIVKTWLNDMTSILKTNNDLDQECLLILDSAKTQTTKEISTIYKNRQQFQGYNLSNVKK